MADLPLTASTTGVRMPLETGLAVARVGVAFLSVVAVSLDPAFRPGLPVVAVYTFYAAGVLALLWMQPRLGASLAAPLHVSDVGWIAVLSIVVEGPASPFFVLMPFMLFAAAFRWGLRATIVTAAAGVLLQAAVGVHRAVSHAESGPTLLVLRGGLLLAGAGLVGFLVERERHSRFVTATLARLSSKARVDLGLGPSMQAILEDSLEVFGGSRVLLALEEVATGHLVVWDGARRPTGLFVLTRAEPPASGRPRYFCESPHGVTAWQATRRKREPHALDVTAIAGDGSVVPTSSWRPPTLLDGDGWRSTLCVMLKPLEEWNARLFLVDPTRHGRGCLPLLQTFWQQVSREITALYVVSRLRAEASAMERARVARELHDTIVQALVGIDMQLEVVRRGLGDNLVAGDALARVQRLLQTEIGNLRDLMLQLRPIEIDGSQLVEQLADRVERFGRETGIRATFDCVLDDVDLSPSTCREIAMIVQEALVNVRKHSGATRVTVRLEATDGFTLTVDDNGRGFGFAGRLEGDELEASGRAPAVIAERARTIGAALAVTSAPGRCSVEILLRRPQSERGATARADSDRRRSSDLPGGAAEVAGG
jgi:signal transduction histidine kinase